MCLKMMIADDHNLVRSGLVRFFTISPELQVVGEASCGSEVLDKLRTLKVDLLMLDLVMPGISGSELVARVRSAHPSLRILVLSMHNDTQTVLRAMRAGASGYINKNCSPQKLMEAVNKVATTGQYLEPEMAQRLAYAASSSTVPSEFSCPNLSEREMQIFRLIVAGKCIKEIGNELHISDKTVSAHKARILAKLSLKSIADMVHYAIQGRLLT